MEGAASEREEKIEAEEEKLAVPGPRARGPFSKERLAEIGRGVGVFQEITVSELTYDTRLGRAVLNRMFLEGRGASPGGAPVTL